MVKKICLVFFIGFVAAAFLFYDSCQTLLLTTLVQNYIHKEFGHHLIYKKVWKEGNHLTFVQPHFEDENVFKSENIVLTYDWTLSGVIYLSIQMEKPYFHLKKGQNKIKELAIGRSFFKSNVKWLEIHSRIEMVDGNLSWDASEGADPSIQFDLAFNGDQGGFLIARLANDPHANLLKILAFGKNKEMHVDINCMRFSCNPFLALLQGVFPQLDELAIPSGHLTGELKAILPENGKPYLEGNLLLSDLTFEMPSHQLSGAIELAQLDLIKNTDVNDPSLASYGKIEILKSAKINYCTWQVENLVGKVSLNGTKDAVIALEAVGLYEEQRIPLHLDGMINLNAQRHLNAALQLAGMKGNVDIEWMSGKELVTLKLVSQIKEIVPFLPEKIKAVFQDSFRNDSIVFLANVKKHLDHFELTGTAHVQHHQTEDFDLIHFGFDLPRKSILTNPKGWFHARSLPLKKYLAPFMFKTDVLEMTGVGEFRGSLTNRLLTVKYGIDDLKLENDFLTIKVENEEARDTNELKGVYEIDFETFAQSGQLPLNKTSYLDKNTGLVFEDIGGQVNFKKTSLSIESMEAFCHDVYFSGSLHLDYSDPLPGFYTLSIQSPYVTGKVSQVKELLAHFHDTSLLNQLCIEGDLSSHEKGLELFFTFTPSEYFLNAAVQGTISNGSLLFESADMSLKGLYMDFDYCHNQELLSFNDVQGSLLIGKPNCVEEYTFFGNHITIKGLEEQDVDIDINIKDQDEELIRVVAKTEQAGNGIRNVVVDQTKTHLSGVYPKNFCCCLSQHGFESFNFESSFELNHFVKDLKRFKQTGLFCFSQDLISKMAHFEPIQGQVNLKIAYHTGEDLVEYVFFSEKINIHSLTSHRGLLKGRKWGKKWFIDQLLWDNVNLFAELEPTDDDYWKVSSLGINDGDCLLLGLQGNLNPDISDFSGKVNLCEINLAEIERMHFLKDAVHEWPLRGLIKATGDFHLKLLDEAPWVSLKSDLQSTTSSLSINEIPFYYHHPFCLKIIPTQHSHSATLNLKKGYCLYNNKTYPLNDLEVKVSHDTLKADFKTNYKRTFFHVRSEATWPLLNQGKITLIDSLARPFANKEPLVLTWDKVLSQKPSLLSIHGNFCGIRADLIAKRGETQSDWSQLEGQVDMDFKYLPTFLDPSEAQTLHQLETGSIYTLSGLFQFNPFSHLSFSETLSFNGKLSSQDFFLKGYRLSTLEADLQATSKRVSFEHLNIVDPSGNLYSDKLIVNRDPHKGLWIVHSPKISIKKFRPALLRQSKPSLTTRFKSLLIKKIEIEDFYGQLANSKTWVAKGDFHFQNTTRKNSVHPLLVIPNEIILRLGLDPSVLNPVTGSIYFNLKDGRFYLTKMKDVYSEGRGSRFYLAAKGNPSWVDVEGNLSLQIRMKQYNILFKIAELFTVSVKGTMKRPTYTLQKHSK